MGEDVVEELAHFDDLVLRLLCCSVVASKSREYICNMDAQGVRFVVSLKFSVILRLSKQKQGVVAGGDDHPYR